MRLAIDCRLIGSTGIGTYIENVLTYIVLHREHTFLLIGNEMTLSEYANHPNCTILNCTSGSFTPKELLCFPTKEVNECDAFYTPNFNLPLGIKVPIFSTIHDILFFETGKFGSWIHQKALHWYVNRALKVSQKVFTVSEFSKHRIQNYFHTSKELSVAYNGVSKALIDYEQSHAKPSQKRGIVFIGNLKRHKGIDLLWRAYKRLMDENPDFPKLTIIGSCNFRTKDEDIITEIEANKDKINLFSNIDNETLYRIVSEAEVLVSPSRYEGFGLPPLEALYLGTPVIISDIEVYKEVYHSLPVTYFTDGDADALYKKLKSFRAHEEDAKATISSIYSYEKTAEKIIKEIESYQ